MSISIINNIPALSAQRQLAQVNLNLGRTIFKLSTGLRINSAVDDAAGLAISERLRARIRSLEQGTINAQDAVSVLQTAEGGLQEATQILQRIRVLAENAASGTKSDADRALLQIEVDQLLQELDRLATTTKFVDITLLDGSIRGASNGVAATVAIASNEFIGPQSTPLVAMVSVSAGAAGAFSLSNAAFQLKVVQGASAGSFTVQIFSSLSTAAQINSGVPLLEASIGGPIAFQLVTIPTGSQGTFSLFLNSNGLSLQTGQVGKSSFVTSTAAQLTSTVDNSLLIQIGGAVGETIKVFAPSVRSNDLFNSQSVRLNTFLQAEGLINQTDQALDIVVRGRATLGALQNRFEGSIRNNQIFQENLTASESRIRDLNVANEASNFTKNQILLQSTTAFLAQANLIPQSLLQLFR